MNDFSISTALQDLNITTRDVILPNVEPSDELTQLTGLAEFNQRAGIHKHVAPMLSLQQRLAAMQQRRLPVSRMLDNSIGMDWEVDEHLNAASVNLLSSLQKKDGVTLAGNLLSDYDVLERHALLRQARAKLEESGPGLDDSDALKLSLDTMLSDLMAESGDVIRKGLDDKENMKFTLAAMNDLSALNNRFHDSESLNELRALYCNKNRAGSVAPFNACSLAKTLQERFGVKNFVAALASLRKKSSDIFRTKKSALQGAGLWISLSDAQSFNSIQSSFAIAGDLLCDLGERAFITPMSGQAETALTLLEVAEYGNYQGNALVTQIVGQGRFSAIQMAQVYMLTRRSIEKIPLTMWSVDSLTRRNGLLEDLKNLATMQFAQSSKVSGREFRLEQQLRSDQERA